MTIENTPPSQAGPAPAYRRRRRRHKGPSNGPQTAQPPQQSAPAGTPPSPQGGQTAQDRANGAPRSQKQGKRRFFKKRAGAQGHSQPQGRGRQARQPRAFVGPMDHSYRAVHDEFSDAPPSTIELLHGNKRQAPGGNGNGNGLGLPTEDVPVSTQESHAPAADAPVHIYCFIEDLFFLAKIQETARKLGVRVAFLKNDKDVLDRLEKTEEAERPALIVFDLNNASARPLTLIPKIKAKFKRTVSVIGFLSHLQGDLKAKAAEAGCDVVMPRSAFSQNLPVLLRRYGLKEDHEHIEA